LFKNVQNAAKVNALGPISQSFYDSLKALVRKISFHFRTSGFSYKQIPTDFIKQLSETPRIQPILKYL